MIKFLIYACLCLGCLQPGFGEVRVTARLTSAYGMPDENGDTEMLWQLDSMGDQAVALQLRHRLRDAAGETLTQLDDEEMVLNGSRQLKVPLQVERFGPVWYEGELRDKKEKALLHRVEQRIVRLAPVPQRSLSEREASFVGVNTHEWAEWDLLSRMGIHWGRDYFWNRYGRGLNGTVSPLGVDFNKRLESAENAGIVMLPCIQKTFVNEDKTRWLEDSEAIVEIFTRMGNHFPDQKLFQIGNEEESTFPGIIHDPDNYAFFIRHAYEGLQAAGHGQQLILSGDRFMYPEVMKEVMRQTQPEHFVASAIHIYTGTIPPELSRHDTNVGGETRSADALVLDQIRDYVRLMKSQGHEVWITETGWDVIYGPAVGERLQASWLPRMSLLSRWVGVEKIFWFFDRDTNDQVRFASSGLSDLNGDVRPSAATLAALSSQVVGTTRGGSADLGDEELWCLLWDKAGGGGVATVWSVDGSYPAPEILKRARVAYDQYGNPRAADAAVLDEVGYYHFDAWPAEWQAQRQVELLSHRIVQVPLGGMFEIEVTERESSVNWELRSGDTDWKFREAVEGNLRRLSVSLPRELEVGTHVLELVAAGDGWKRKWLIRLEVGPVLSVQIPPYAAGEEVEILIRRLDGRQAVGQVWMDDDLGQGTPVKFSAEPEEAFRISLQTHSDATGAIPVIFELENGVRQIERARPSRIAVPQLKLSPDAAWSSWPQSTRWPSDWFAQDRMAPEAAMAWSEEGLHVAVGFKVDSLHNLDPKWFWTAQNVELFLQPSGAGGRMWTPDTRQFWLQPVEGPDGWHTLAGEWRERVHPGEENVYGHPDLKTHLQYHGGFLVMSALIPAEALGKAPRAGDNWRAALTVQNGAPAQMNLRAAWPISKAAGVLEAPDRWGTLQFEATK